MNLLVLHRRLSGYFIACLKALARSPDHNIITVAWPDQKDAPFDPSVFYGIGTVKSRGDYTAEELHQLAEDFRPDCVLVSGWSDKGYLKVCRALKAGGVMIISGCDTQWKGSLRQQVACAVAPWHVQKFIDVFWVTGERQRQFAAKLGYPADRCWDGYYACDWDLFSAVAEKRSQETKAENLNEKNGRSFCYVGRYVPVKGLDTLAEAYRLYSENVESPWKLICAGKGECREDLIAAGAEDRGFIQPEALPTFFAEASAFILPSRFEPWGVVVQEAAATGLPVIVSDACGAGVHLLRDRWNGRSFAGGDAAHLADCMLWMHQQTEGELAALGRNSFELSKQYTPERWAETLATGVARWKEAPSSREITAP